MGVHEAARISTAGHGGQVLLSSTTRELVADDLPESLALRDLGDHLLKDLDRPERVYELRYPGVLPAFPPIDAPGLLRAARQRAAQSAMTVFHGRARIGHVEEHRSRQPCGAREQPVAILLGPDRRFQTLRTNADIAQELS